MPVDGASNMVGRTDERGNTKKQNRVLTIDAFGQALNKRK